MKNKILAFTKGILGIGLFYLIQIIWSILFSKYLTKGGFLGININLILCELIIAIIFIWINRKRFKQDYQDFNQNYKKYLLIGLKYWFIGIIVMITSNIIITNFIISDVAANEAMNREILFKYPYYAVIAMIILAPIAEELIFRVNFRKAFTNKWTFALVTSLLFASAHVLNGITSPLEILYLIPYGSLAVSLALTFYETDNIYTSIIIHNMHNTLSVIQLIILYVFLGA